MKIVILDGHTTNPGDLSWAEYEEIGELTVYDKTSFETQEELERRIGDADIVLLNKTTLNAQAINNAPNLKYIGLLSTGYNIVDIHAAKEKGIVVANVPTYGSEAVGQFAIALLLEICNRVGHHNNAVHDGKWITCGYWCFWDYSLIELLGKTMGIIGLGRIGQSVARIAKALGMNVIAYDEFQSDAGKEVATYVELDELLAKSDVISLHCPLFPTTEGIIRKENIDKMKDNVIIINNSRGGLIVESDLADALNSGKVLAAGLDVSIDEPMAEDHPLMNAKNCIITPHISWAPTETRGRMLHIAAENIRQFLNGTPTNVVN